MSDVYCSKKFDELQVDVQSRLFYNCCRAWPESIDLDWLENNPGKLFHTPTMLADRQLMLEGKRSKSCEFGCYQYEDRGLISYREKYNEKIVDPYNKLKKLQITISNDCNLTCAYCFPIWSSAWTHDIDKNGEYPIEVRDQTNRNWTKLWSKIKQKDRSTNSRFFKLLLNEISLATSIEQVSLKGGEPLLNNDLIKVFERIQDKKITIVSGLGISDARFKNIIGHIKNYKNISFTISAESTNSIFEFVRYGAQWNDFLQKIEYLKKYNFKIAFNSTITNITSFDILPFYEMFGKEHKIIFNPVGERPFLQPNVLDDLSKQNLLDSIKDKIDNKFFLQLKQSVSQEYSDNERKKLSVFLKEFSNRRKLKLDIFPVHFLKWLDLN
jgi:organic radical activating enzyme